MDVVQAVAADWRFDPYSGEVADGYVFGRGSLDDKGMGVMELMTMLLLKRRNVELTRDVIMLATCDEEIGSPMGARWMIDNHFADLDPAYVLDEGGTGMRGFFHAGDTFEISVSEKRMVRIRLVAHAEPGHASMPWHEAATHRLVRARAHPPGAATRGSRYAGGCGDDQSPGRRVGPPRDRLTARQHARAARHDQPDDAQRRLQDQRHP